MNKNETIQVDVTKLKQLSQESEAANQVFAYLIKRGGEYTNKDGKKIRGRARGDTNIKRVQRLLKEEGREFPQYAIADVFKKLEALNVGTIKNGRNGNPSRFFWKGNLRDIKKILTGELLELSKYTPAMKNAKLPRLQGVPSKQEPPKAAPIQAVVEVKNGHILVVRKGDVAIEVPADITSEEAKGVATLFNSLSVA